MELKINKTSRLDGFILASVLLHFIVFALQAIWPNTTAEPPKSNPVKVKFVEAPLDKEEIPTIIEAPPSKKEETPLTKKFLSNTNSRMHNNRAKKKAEEFRSHRTVMPKSLPAPQPMPKPRPVEPPKPKPVPPVTPPKTLTAPSVLEGGVVDPKSEEVSKQEPEKKVEEVQKAERADPVQMASKAQPNTTFLDGFDAEKYADLDTEANPFDEADDDEPISLDTTESKYVSYFARIKRQIERVWNYPLEAARQGISGELTLRFQISRDGNLLAVGVVDASGHEILDYAAIKAVKGAAPFYPIPVTIERNKLSILATFIYSPNYSAP